MLKMFRNEELPNDARSLNLLKRVNDLREENAWVTGVTQTVQHFRVPRKTKRKIIEIASNNPESLEELLDGEICFPQLIAWVNLQLEETADV